MRQGGGGALLVALVLLGCAGAWPRRCEAQAWRTALTVAADGALWIDYCEDHYALSHGLGIRTLGMELTPTGLAVLNGGEVLANTFLPKRWRLWVNLATIAYHVPWIAHEAHRAVTTVAQPDGSVTVVRIGFRIWP